MVCIIYNSLLNLWKVVSVLTRDVTSLLFRELERGEALALIDEHVGDEKFKKILLDKTAQPFFTVAYKNLFNGVYVFPVKLTERLLMVITLDRRRFWVKL